MLLPPESSTLRAAQQRSLSEPPLRFRVFPESSVGFRAGVALGAAVPEASVDEDGDFLLGERKVGLAGQRKMPSPSGHLCLAQMKEEHLFGLFVSASIDQGHHN
jgi:hypothetical protein